jgi:aminopeptidase N
MFSRWQALTTLAMPNLVKATNAVRNGSTVEFDSAFINTLIEIIGDDALEPAFRAQVLALPSESDIAREIGSGNDPDAIHKARNAAMAAIAKAGVETLTSLFDTFEDKGTYSPDATSAGRRSLRNIAMSYLSFAEDTPKRASDAFAAASNMTDLAHALSILTQRFPDSSEAAQALATFEARFADNALVLDKWLSIQAAIPGEGALGRIKSLTGSKHFVGTNPNRVRSLIGTFAFGNPTGFNRADGEAYRFLAEQIVTIDKRNPQLAARILTSMRSWRSLEPVRADHARAALTTIERSPALSTDVRDIVERVLKA